MRRIIFHKKYGVHKYGFIVLVSYTSFFLCSCNSVVLNLEASNKLAIEATVSPTDSGIKQSNSQNQNQTKSISFKGVSLQTDLPLVSDIKASEEPATNLEDERDKPDYVQSRHILLKLNGEYAEQHKESYYSPKLNIYPIAEFRQAFARSPSLVNMFDEEIKSLQNIIFKKTAKKEELPRIPFYDGTPEILARLKHIRFRNGEGILYITQYNVDYATIINNQQISYIFQGITMDKKYYVLATFPITLKELPKSIYDNKFREYELPQDFLNPKTRRANEAEYKKYLSSIETLLNKQKESDFDPDLNNIKETISSLEVDWNE